jgi:hypothetical protein
MRTLLVPALSLLLAFFATSCNFTENITVNPDGSGKASFDLDGSQLMGMAGRQMADKKIDTTFTFKEIFAKKKDSIAKLPKAEQARLKSLENMQVKMIVNAEDAQLNINVLNDFKKANEIGDVMKAFKDIAAVKNPKKAESLGFLDNHSTVKYSYDGKTFKKNVEMVKNVAAQQDTLSMYKSMMEGSTYTVKYKFPKKIKKVSNPAAIISEDKKGLSLTYDLTEYLDHPTQLALDVEFEK